MSAPRIMELNIEQGMPRAQQGRMLLIYGLQAARVQKAQIVKVIHGYGSSGPGGSLRQMTQVVLQTMLTKREIKAFVPGDRFQIFDPAGRAVLDAYPELAKDKDLGRNNRGITLVLL